MAATKGFNKFGYTDLNFGNKVFMLNIGTVVSAFVVLFIEIYQIVKVEMTEGLSINDYFDLFVLKGFIFIILGLGFLISGIQTMRTLKRLFREFYVDNRCILSFAIISLSVPLIARGCVGIALGYNSNMREYAYFEELTFDAVFYFIGTVIPVGC